MTIDDQQERDEVNWERGHRAAYNAIMGECLRQLRGDADVTKEVLLHQMERIRAMLRQVCERHGDNDWPDDLDLADVIDKHLWRHLEED